MSMAPVDVIVDSREAGIKVRKDCTVADYLRSLGLQVSISPLPCGDYFLAAPDKIKCVLIERKTVTDFANAIRSGRLWSQLEPLALARQDFTVVVVLEGWVKLLEKFTEWRPSAVMSIIEAIESKYGIPIVPSANFQWTATYIVAKAKQLGRSEEKKVYPIRYGKKPMDVQERILYVAEGLVGPTLARRLLEQFRTLTNIANATPNELKRVQGIGAERARLIWQIFNTPYNQQSGERKN